MKPQDPHARQRQVPLIPQRAVLYTPPSTSREEKGQEATANLARQQLQSIYSGNTSTPTPQTTPVATQEPQQPAEPRQQPETADNPYAKTHTAPASVSEEHWQRYHSAWQDYYQKYYERYYIGQLHQARQSLEARVSEAAVQNAQENAKPQTSDRPTASLQDGPAESSFGSSDGESLSRSEAMYELRSNLLGKIRTGATKARKSRHFIPITAAACVMLLFLFLQYNRVLFANVQAYVSPGTIDPANVIVDPTAAINVGPDSKLIIPKINVDVPIVFDTKPDQASQQKAMETGVSWFGIPGADSKPGQIGNTVLSGHSSNDIVDRGEYKFIFARLEQLTTGDMIYVNYGGKRYSYTVTKEEVVKPTDVKKLVYPTDKPILTLITCTPIGTALNRLLVTAEQVSPDPAAAEDAPRGDGDSSSGEMPGNSATFIQRIFGG